MKSQSPSRKILVSVTNDLVTDNRVKRLCSMLTEMGHTVEFIGRKLPESPPLSSEKYTQTRMRLLFSKSAFFYAEYNIRLFFHLLFSKSDVLVANDLDTLPANYLVSRFKNIPLVYDSHELFTEVPELEENAFAKWVWLRIEKSIVPRLSHCITVNQSIADILEKRYGVKFLVFRNMPYRFHPPVRKTRAELGLPADKKIIILQGNGINVRRGAEEAVEAMKHIDFPCLLLIIGNGDVIPALKQKVQQENLHEKVWFKGRLPYEELMQYTLNADLGITLDKGDNLNYLYSLPNKIFDYIQAGIPVLSSPLPELKNIIETYEVGDCIEQFETEHIAKKMEECLNDENRRSTWKKNLTFAAEKLCRENEEIELKKRYEQILQK
ncbi:MAG: glycosyltransferase [Flavobacteriales bacterium]|nr:glycosyltransferase [Flavobacteriales bacterium]